MAEFTLTAFNEVLRASEGDSREPLSAAQAASGFEDLGFDSLLVYEMVTRIQDGFGVRIPDEALERIKSPESLIDYVQAALAA
jgi:acyl carrier protein